MEQKRIQSEGLDEILGGLKEEEKITASDKELLKLTDENPQLTVVETGEDFDWSKGSGNYYEVVAEKSFDKPSVSYMNDTLDIYQVHLNKIGKLGPAYFLRGEIKLKGDENKRISAKNIVLTDKDGSKIDLGDYQVRQSGRSREFYGFTDQGLRENGLEPLDTFNQTSVSALFIGKENMLVVYRMTFNGGEMIGSRLYVQKANEKKYVLDQTANDSLVLFMQAINQIHDSEIKETSCDVTDISEKPKEGESITDQEKPKKEENIQERKRYDYLPGYA